MASALKAYLPQARWTEPEGDLFTGVHLPPDVETSLLQARGQELGVRPGDGRGFFPDQSGDALVRLPFVALSAEQTRGGMEPCGSIVDTLIQ